ncbi:MAG TPA: molybdopterin-binding oxidoreductase, partial [Burkholderiaceae bacterium]|nr:molybdopterin-binding oxidoreductase [Burkholderiaceae bacterium]
MKGTGFAALAVTAWLSGCGGSDVDRGPLVPLEGKLNQPGDYAVTYEPAVTQSVTFQSGAGTQNRQYTGTSLYDLLSKAGITVDPAIRNDALNRYVIVTGSDGYRSVHALGEINPDFGNRPSLVAWAETVNGVSTPLTGDGPIRTTSPGDVRGGRYVSNVVKIELQASESTLAGSGGGQSTQFTAGGPVALRPGSYDLAALQALPVTSVTVNGSTYTGVNLWTFVNTVIGLVSLGLGPARVARAASGP